jgi:hypothetical protein
MSWACGTYGDNKRPPGRSSSEWKGNIEIYLREIEEIHYKNVN